MAGPAVPSTGIDVSRDVADADELTSRVAAPSDPYATLAATPDPVEGDESGVEPD